jgi:hypothetical protein
VLWRTLDRKQRANPLKARSYLAATTVGLEHRRHHNATALGAGFLEGSFWLVGRPI